MKESIICQPRSPKDDWILIKTIAKTVWEWIKFEWTVIH